MLTMKTFQKNAVLFATILFLASCGGGEKNDTADGKGDKEEKDTASAASSKKKTNEGKEEISAAKFANLVRKRIVERAKKNDGYLEFEEPQSGDSVKVELQKVVEKSVRKSAKNVRLVCGKFKGVDNDKDYDIDFFMEGKEPSSLEPARDPLFHKVDGEPRHTYVKNEEGFVQPQQVDEEGTDEEGKEMEKEGMDKSS